MESTLPPTLLSWIFKKQDAFSFWAHCQWFGWLMVPKTCNVLLHVESFKQQCLKHSSSWMVFAAMNWWLCGGHGEIDLFHCDWRGRRDRLFSCSGLSTSFSMHSKRGLGRHNDKGPELHFLPVMWPLRSQATRDSVNVASELCNVKKNRTNLKS